MFFEFLYLLFFYVSKLGTIDLSSTSAEKCFFGDLAIWKSNFSLHLSIDLNFRHTSKKIKGGSLKKILEKKNVFPKKYVEISTFDGNTLILPFQLNQVKNKEECKKLKKAILTHSNEPQRYRYTVHTLTRIKWHILNPSLKN